MNKLNEKFSMIRHQLVTLSGVKIFALFIAAIIVFGGYYTVVIPKHFLFESDIIAHEISLKEHQLNSELRELIAQTIHRYADTFLLRLEDGASIYSYTQSSPNTSTPIHIRITPDTVRVQNATVRDGLVEFQLRLPALEVAQQEITLRPLISCGFTFSESRTTDAQNDLINCQNPATGRVNPLTHFDFFYVTPPDDSTPTQIVFEDLNTIMPLARNLALNNSGHFGRELSHFKSMLLMSIGIITTSGTGTAEPVSVHAKAVVALESITGIFLFIWFLSVRIGVVSKR
jgi:hypothetical protein